LDSDIFGSDDAPQESIHLLVENCDISDADANFLMNEA